MMQETIPNGGAAAAILAAGLGCFTLALLSLSGDASKAIAHGLTFCVPTGPLSGVTTLGIVAWLAAWLVGHWMWRSRTVAVRRAALVSLALVVLGLLLTFPPIEDLLLRK
jgi:hypothetical protein